MQQLTSLSLDCMCFDEKDTDVVKDWNHRVVSSDKIKLLQRYAGRYRHAAALDFFIQLLDDNIRSAKALSSNRASADAEERPLVTLSLNLDICRYIAGYLPNSLWIESGIICLAEPEKPNACTQNVFVFSEFIERFSTKSILSCSMYVTAFRRELENRRAAGEDIQPLCQQIQANNLKSTLGEKPEVDKLLCFARSHLWLSEAKHIASLKQNSGQTLYVLAQI